MNDNLKTLRQWHGEFIDMQDVIRKLRPATIKSYKDTFNVFLKLTSEDLMPRMLSPELMVQFFKKLETRERKVGVTIKTGIKSSTTRTYYSKLRPFFEWLVKRKIIDITPFDGIDIPKVVYDDVRWLKKDDVDKIFTATALNINWNSDFIKNRNLAIFHILLFTGIRKGELLGLKVLDIDLENGFMRIDGATSKSKTDREVFLNTKVVRAIKTYLDYRKWSSSSSLLVSEKGEGFTEAGLKHMINKVVKESGVRFHVHRFRHTYAMNMVNKGCDVAQLQNMMGHKDIRQTSVYLRKMPSSIVRKTVELLDFETLV